MIHFVKERCALMEHWLLMYNPASGKGNRIRSQLDGIIEIFQSKDKFITTYRLDHTTPSDVEAVLDSAHYDGIIACGGDGSVKFIGGLLAKKGLDIPLGVLPNGTCNDFARSLGLPTDLHKCAKVLAEGRTKRVDIGLINGQEYFVNEVAGGMLVDVSYNVDDALKQKIGSLAYYLAGMSELAKIKTVPLKIETEEGATYEIDAYLFLALNGTDAAGMSGLIKEALMDDGALDILVFKKSDLIGMTDTLLKLVTTADFQEKCVERIRTKACRITCCENLATTLDGEKGPQLPLDIRMIAKAINVLY